MSWYAFPREAWERVFANGARRNVRVPNFWKAGVRYPAHRRFCPVKMPHPAVRRFSPPSAAAPPGLERKPGFRLSRALSSARPPNFKGLSRMRGIVADSGNARSGRNDGARKSWSEKKRNVGRSDSDSIPARYSRASDLRAPTIQLWLGFNVGPPNPSFRSNSNFNGFVSAYLCVSALKIPLAVEGLCVFKGLEIKSSAKNALILVRTGQNAGKMADLFVSKSPNAEAQRYAEGG